ncbi:MAG: ARPP-1 family domain-containing protein [Burkholderiales bacterium]
MPTIIEVDPIHRALATLTPGDPVRHGTLTVVPLLGPEAEEPGWLTLAEAGEAVTVTEVSEAGAVPFLKVANGADRPVLLLDGEELVGAKQNRVLNTTVLVAARSTVVIPVTCVEQGRWAYRSHRFSGADTSLFASLRAKKAARVSAAVRETGQHLSDQGDVWQDLAGRARTYKVESPTGAMHAVYERYAADVAAARSALSARPGQVGALVFLGDQWAGLDLLASPGLFATAWPRLCAGYAADAIGSPEIGTPAEGPEAVLARLTATPIEPAPPVGLGQEFRLVGREVLGAALVMDDRLAHLAAFPTGGAN